MEEVIKLRGQLNETKILLEEAYAKIEFLEESNCNLHYLVCNRSQVVARAYNSTPKGKAAEGCLNLSSAGEPSDTEAYVWLNIEPTRRDCFAEAQPTRPYSPFGTLEQYLLANANEEHERDEREYARLEREKKLLHNFQAGFKREGAQVSYNRNRRPSFVERAAY